MANGSLYSFLLSDKLSRENPYDFRFDPLRVFFSRYISERNRKTTDKLGFFDVLIAWKMERDLSISIQFSFSRVFSYRHGQMRELVVRFVPEQTISQLAFVSFSLVQ